MTHPSNPFPRIGLGWDTHQLAAGRAYVLGGVLLDSPLGPLGHSDGDAILHALTDALLGAAGLDDIGTLFPDHSAANKDRNSAEFLGAAMEKLGDQNLQLASADLVVICDEPRIGPYRQSIRENLSQLMNIPVDRVNLKGKSTEGGDDNRVTVQAVVLLVKA